MKPLPRQVLHFCADSLFPDKPRLVTLTHIDDYGAHGIDNGKERYLNSAHIFEYSPEALVYAEKIHAEYKEFYEKQGMRLQAFKNAFLCADEEGMLRRKRYEESLAESDEEEQQ